MHSYLYLITLLSLFFLLVPLNISSSSDPSPQDILPFLSVNFLSTHLTFEEFQHLYHPSNLHSCLPHALPDFWLCRQFVATTHSLPAKIGPLTSRPTALALHWMPLHSTQLRCDEGIVSVVNNSTALHLKECMHIARHYNKNAHAHCTKSIVADQSHPYQMQLKIKTVYSNYSHDLL